MDIMSPKGAIVFVLAVLAALLLSGLLGRYGIAGSKGAL